MLVLILFGESPSRLQLNCNLPTIEINRVGSGRNGFDLFQPFSSWMYRWSLCKLRNRPSLSIKVLSIEVLSC